MKTISSIVAAFCLTRGNAFAPIYSGCSPVSPSSKTVLHSTVASTNLAEGLIKTVTQQGNGARLKYGEVATVKYSCYVPTSDGSTPQPFAQSLRQKVVVGDGVMIQGWDEALPTMYVGERAIIRVENTEQFGYGAAGVPPLIPANAVIEIDIEVFEAEAQSQMGSAGAGTLLSGSGDLGALDPMKPRTPEAIAAAYKTRQEQMAIEKLDEKEGLEGWIEKAKNFYFFGFFEGETGEKAPWILRPSITFPIAFAVVGVTFWVAFTFGGIRERGTQVKDELDDIILSYDVVKNALVVAMSSNRIEL